MATFFLYRLKIERWETPSLFDDQSRSAGETILSAIEEKPSHELRKNQSWRIGNVEKLSSGSVFFALGKITKTTQEFYDESQGDFVQKPFDEAPHTYVAVDLELQVCGIAHKPKIAPDVGNIAKNLARLLSQSETAQTRRLSFVLSGINNPEQFLTLVRNAFRISYFEMTFTPPNPFDVERQFYKPSEKLLEATNANHGKTSIYGTNLEPKVIEELTRSTAATGNEAKARIQQQKGGRLSLKKSVGNQIKVSIDTIIRTSKDILFRKIRDEYYNVRGPEQKL